MGKPTESQMRVPREIAADRVRWGRYEGRFWSTVFPPAVRSDVVRRVVNGGFATIGPALFSPPSSNQVVLTDTGRAALEQEEDR